MAGEAMNPRGVSTTATILNQYNSKMHAEHYPYSHS